MTRNYKKHVLQLPGGPQMAAIETANSNARPQIIGYARVSTEEQILDVQMTALKGAGCDIIFSEKVSAADLRRPQFALMQKHIEPGDTIVVHAFSRISRNLKDLLVFLDDMKAFGVTIRSTSEPQIDPYTTHGRMHLQMVGLMDEHERNRVKDRTKAAMAEKARQGMSLGRPRVVALKDIPKMRAMRKRGVSVEDIAAKFKCSKPCVYSHTANL